MKKILMCVVLLMVAVGCSSAKKTADNSEAGGVTTETTATGGSEQVDTSALNFSASGSDSGTIEGLQTVRFDFDSAAISEEEQKKLEGNADWMKKYATVNIVIEGHCDQRGSNEYNLSLGERRANAVKQALVNMGVAASRITTSSFGEEKPLANGDSEAEMSQNRRANFVPTK
jgi:peptidoglycan-associated lipoprotein